MKRKIYFTYFLILPLFLFSQKVEFKVGAEYRITPIQKARETAYIPNIKVFSESDRQLMGTSFNYSLSYLFKNGFGIGFSHSFKYGHIYYEPSDNKTLKSVNDLITDYKIFVKKEFYIQNNTYFIEFGGNLMNNGTTYAEKDYIDAYDDNGNQLYWLAARNMSFGATNITIGMIYNKIDFGIGMYFSNGSDGFSRSDKFKLPYFKVNYIVY